ncbi:MAG: vWA domain-containing protein [Polyangiaceae bacterium]
MKIRNSNLVPSSARSSVRASMGIVLALAGAVTTWGSLVACSGSQEAAVPPDPDGGTSGNADSGFGRDDGGAIANFDGSACATSSATAALDPLDILIALDKSGSMLAENKWGAVTSAIKGFVSNRNLTSLAVGLEYFPLRRICAVDAYEQPEVPITELPQGTPNIITSLSLQEPNGGTPMAPALQGAVNHARAWARTHPDHTVVVVLATDGVPDANCAGGSGVTPNDIDGVVSIANASANASPRIPTFVIGVGDTLSALNRIAVAGATDSAFLLDTTKDVQKSFAEALAQVRKRSLSCQYGIPRSATGDIDYSKVNVQFRTESSAAVETWPAVTKADACKNTRSWYYDSPTQPTKVVLCPDACAAVTDDETARVDVLFGCATVLR